MDKDYNEANIYFVRESKVSTDSAISAKSTWPSDYHHSGLSMAIIINYSFFQNLSFMYICQGSTNLIFAFTNFHAHKMVSCAFVHA